MAIGRLEIREAGPPNFSDRGPQMIFFVLPWRTYPGALLSETRRNLLHTRHLNLSAGRLWPGFEPTTPVCAATSTVAPLYRLSYDEIDWWLDHVTHGHGGGR